MNINDAYPSKYLKTTDLPDEGSQPVTIEKIILEEVGKDRETKPVIYFEEFSKALVCNKTNARTIARALSSEDFDDWIGRRIALYRTEVEFGGEMMEGIRVKAAKSPTKPAEKPATPAAVRTRVTEPADGDDGIPF